MINKIVKNMILLMINSSKVTQLIQDVSSKQRMKEGNGKDNFLELTGESGIIKETKHCICKSITREQQWEHVD
jgi:hypothetical protein